MFLRKFFNILMLFRKVYFKYFLDFKGVDDFFCLVIDYKYFVMFCIINFISDDFMVERSVVLVIWRLERRDLLG